METAVSSVIRGRGRRCDRRCYDGATPRVACTCICGGRNHGVGLRQAETNTIELFAAAAALEGAQPAMPMGGRG